MAFHGLWGWILWLSISKVGLGVSTDSVHFLFGGLNLARGRGLFSFDGNFLLVWPPLYPVLLALIHWLTGWNTFISAEGLQIASFIGISLCLSLLFLKIFPDHFWLAMAGNVLSDIVPVMPATFDVVGSDYVHLLFVSVFLLLAGYYLERRTSFLWILLCLLGMLASLQRYLGLAVIVTAVILIFLFDGSGIRTRLLRCFLTGLSALPAGLWLFFTSSRIEGRSPISFLENFTWFSRAILEWFSPSGPVQSHLFLFIFVLWLFILGLLAVWFLVPPPGGARPGFALPVLIYGLVYLLTLFGSASLTYFNKLDGRFLLPLVVPLVSLLVSAIGRLWQKSREFESGLVRRLASAGLVGFLAVSAAGLLRVTLPSVYHSYRDGWIPQDAFNTPDWHSNSVLHYWLEHPPSGDYLLLSNYPDGIAFYTWHSCLNAPARFSGPYATQLIPLDQYVHRLFAPGLPVYLIWIEPNVYSYYYDVQDLGSIAVAEPLFKDQDGGVYRLWPASPQDFTAPLAACTGCSR